jgi:hypothetical protein
MVDNSPGLFTCKFGWFFAKLLRRHAISSSTLTCFCIISRFTSHSRVTSWDHCWLHLLSSRYRWQWATEHLLCGPPPTGSASSQSFRPLLIAWPHSCDISLSCLNQGHAQRGMRAHKVRRGLPPVHMSLHVGSLQSSGPRASCQSGHPAADRQVDPRNYGRVDVSRKAQSLSGFYECWLCSQPDDVLDSL